MTADQWKTLEAGMRVRTSTGKTYKVVDVYKAREPRKVQLMNLSNPNANRFWTAQLSEYELITESIVKKLDTSPMLGQGVSLLPMSGKGVSLRDFFAAHALQGLLASDVEQRASFEGSVRDAYVIADAMLAAREVTE